MNRMTELKELLAYINETPELQSLLYDMDLLPEQCPKGSFDHHRMVILTRAWCAEFHKPEKP